MGKKRGFVLILLLITILIVSCTHKTSINSTQNNIMSRLTDNKNTYKNDDPASIKEIYITVMPAKDQPPKYAHTLEELNGDTNIMDDEEISVRVMFQEGKGGAPAAGYYGFGLTNANATMKQRGQSARLLPQKSYKIQLDRGSSLWDGFREINLNKHPFDTLRIRNKMAFDYMKNVSGIVSLRTQFVHLYIKDLSQGNYNEVFKDYGLFTHVENVDKDYLKNHGLDTKGSLYKVENFEFFRYPDQLRLEEDPEYDKKEFEKVLSIKGNSDHRKLLKMLDDVNSEFKNINDVIDMYFDRENYITWLAMNILFDDIDTSSRNFYLYSPSNSSKWYFIPWDYDKSWGGYKNPRGLWQEGASNYWGVVLHKRFLKNRENREELTKRIEELAKIFTEENTRSLIKIYQPIAEYFLSRQPDNQGGKVRIEDIREEFQGLPRLIEENKKKYYESLERPMPIFVGQPIKFANYYIFKWEKAYDFQGDSIKYSVDISRTPDLKNIVFHKNNIIEDECFVEGLTPGKYYLKIGIWDSKGNYQESFDQYIDNATKIYYFGVKEFYAN